MGTCMICFLNIMILVYLSLKLFVPLISIAQTSDVSLLAFKIAINFNLINFKITLMVTQQV